MNKDETAYREAQKIVAEKIQNWCDCDDDAWGTASLVIDALLQRWPNALAELEEVEVKVTVDLLTHPPGTLVKPLYRIKEQT